MVNCDVILFKNIKYYLSVLVSDREMTLSIIVKYNLYVK